MTLQQPPPFSRFPGVTRGEDLVDLAAVLEPDVHVAIWHRPADEQIVRLLEHRDCTLERPSRIVVRSGEMSVAQLTEQVVPEAWGAVDSVAAAMLGADIHRLCEMFAELLCADELMISLEGPDEATCPRFHVDRVGVRMLVTYAGPGTEWLPDEHVDRRWLGEAGHGRPDHENGVMLPHAEVQRVSPFEVVLLKGEAWPGAENFGAVHRSPDPAGGRRVLLRVDMLSQRPVEAGEGAE